jgi:hypothetical protein
MRADTSALDRSWDLKEEAARRGEASAKRRG